MPASPLTLKKQELRRRIEGLPAEVKRWRDATAAEVDLNAHFSQLRAIEIFMKVFTDELDTKVEALAPAGDAKAFNQASLEVVQTTIRAQKCWDFFRDKLDLRHSPTHKTPLWVADTIAWDCHRPVVNLAAELGIVDASHLREPPLVYCTADYSPATWTRGSRPNDGRRYDLGEAHVPIPVIEIPWDHLDNSWEYLSLHHEVGHDIEADLGLRQPLRQNLDRVLREADVPANRVATWLKWQGEVFADLCGLRFAGPAFADALMHLLLLPVANVTAFDEEDPHPTPYVRMLMNAAYIRTLGVTPEIQGHAAQVEQRWTALYGTTSGDAALDAHRQDFAHVFRALIDTPLESLRQRSVAALIPFSAADDARIRGAEKYFRTGMNKPGNVPIRHVPSAARLAIDASNEAGTLTDDVCADVHQRVLDYVKELAPPGFRGGGPDAHEKFIASFTDRMFAA